MAIVKETDRKYPLKRPLEHKPPVPRWTLKLPNGMTNLYTLYIGVQCRSEDKHAASRAEQSIQDWLDDDQGQPAVIDVLRVIDGFDTVDSKVWVAYWTEPDGFAKKLRELNLFRRWEDLGDERQSLGLWCEHFVTPIERLETNYNSLDHKPGVSQVPGSEFPGHDLTAYWGAGRDRIPASAHDLFEPSSDAHPPDEKPAGIGEHLTGTNYDNICHIRSGQWWVECDDTEREAYEEKLQKTLMEGMRFLWEQPEETGTIGLRFLQNLDEDGQPIRESCGAGFHRNWNDLERWSSTHPSHLAIFAGAMQHAKRFGPDKKLMTWHEVSILKAGEAKFEYVNCDPKTGVIGRVPLQRKGLTE